MQSIFQRIQNRASDFAKRLRDLKFAGQMLFLIVVLLISWSGVKSIQSNYILQKQIASLQQQTQVQQLANNNLALENQYYDTDTYKDIAARRNFGLAAPGEKEIIVPKDVALSYTSGVAITDQSSPVQTPRDKQSVYQRNFQGWVNFFMHRQSSAN